MKKKHRFIFLFIQRIQTGCHCLRYYVPFHGAVVMSMLLWKKIFAPLILEYR